jgi:hypothetical protein
VPSEPGALAAVVPSAARDPVLAELELHRKLARRNEDQGDGARAFPRLGRYGVDRQREGGSLSRTGRRLRQDVAPLEKRRDRLLLDRRGLFVPEGRESRDEPGVELERREGG